MYTCIIIDDEPHAIQGVKKYLESLPVFQVVATYNDPSVALLEMQTMQNVDLVLLDIDMPKISGIELSKEIRKKTDKLIFTTGHTKYGYEAFKVDADDYLLKPYTLGEFIIAINKLFPKPSAPIVGPDSFLVKSKEENNRIIAVKYEEVIAVESKLNYITIYTNSKAVTTYMSLSDIFRILEGWPGFFQFHRSFIISYRHIEFIEGNKITMKNGLVIQVREYYRKNFVNFINDYLISAKVKSLG